MLQTLIEGGPAAAPILESGTGAEEKKTLRWLWRRQVPRMARKMPFENAIRETLCNRIAVY
jgi:hypothetical protein